MTVSEPTSSPAADQPVLDDLAEPRLVSETGVAARISTLAEPVLQDLGYRLVRVKISAANGTTVQVMAERPDGFMSVGDCEKASTSLSAVFDVEDVVQQVWHFEMSSPGIDRPMVRVSDFYRAISHEVRMEMSVPVEGRKRFKGWVQRVEGMGKDAIVHLRRTDSLPDEPADVVLPLRDFAEGRLILTEALIRESLRAAKAAMAAAGETEDEAAPDAPPVEAPRKGPGRFAARHGNYVPKSVPLQPAGQKPLRPGGGGAKRPK